MPLKDFDSKLFDEAKEHAKDLVSSHSARNELFDDMYNMSMTKWDKEDAIRAEGKHVVPVISPDPANFIDGIVRLLTTNVPSVSLPKDQTNPDAIQNADELERVANAILINAGRVRGDPIYFDVIRSAVTFSEVQVGLSSTWDLVSDFEKRLAEEKDKSIRKDLENKKERAKKIAEQTPYLIDIFDPRTGYPEWDKFGLSSYLRVYNTTKGELIEHFGERAIEVFSKEAKKKAYKSKDEVAICDLFDLRWHTIWLDNTDDVLLQEEHELPFIPVVAEIIQGSQMWDKPENRRKPPLYNYWRSGAWHTDNVIFSLMTTNMLSLLTMPPFKKRQIEPSAGGEIEIDFDSKPPVIKVPYGWDMEQIQMKVITEDMLRLHDLMQSKGIESTMHRQVLGEPLTGSPSYSMYAFMAQSAKTVLNTIVEKIGWVYADIAKMALEWMRHDKGKEGSPTVYKVREGQGSISIGSADMPEGDFLVECKIKYKLPQDLLGASQVATALMSNPNMPLSAEWITEEVLGVDNPPEELSKKWDEIAAWAHYTQYLQQMMQPPQQPQPPQGAPQQYPEQPPGVPGAIEAAGAPTPGAPVMPGAGNLQGAA